MALNDPLNVKYYGAHNQDENKEIDPLLALSPQMLLSFLINSKELRSASYYALVLWGARWSSGNRVSAFPHELLTEVFKDYNRLAK